MLEDRRLHQRARPRPEDPGEGELVAPGAGIGSSELGVTNDPVRRVDRRGTRGERRGEDGIVLAGEVAGDAGDAEGADGGALGEVGGGLGGVAAAAERERLTIEGAAVGGLGVGALVEGGAPLTSLDLVAALAIEVEGERKLLTGTGRGGHGRRGGAGRRRRGGRGAGQERGEGGEEARRVKRRRSSFSSVWRETTRVALGTLGRPGVSRMKTTSFSRMRSTFQLSSYSAPRLPPVLTVSERPRNCPRVTIQPLPSGSMNIALGAVPPVTIPTSFSSLRAKRSARAWVRSRVTSSLAGLSSSA
jgi:hypothetical protein